MMQALSRESAYAYTDRAEMKFRAYAVDARVR